MKNRIFAIETAPATIPPNPKTAAISATTKNITTHLNIANLTIVIRIIKYGYKTTLLYFYF